MNNYCITEKSQMKNTEDSFNSWPKRLIFALSGLFLIFPRLKSQNRPEIEIKDFQSDEGVDMMRFLTFPPKEKLF